MRTVRWPNEYLLSGRVRCSGYGKHFIGSAAHRYHYYVCSSQQRYGASTCGADRLPAKRLDQAVLEALLDTLQRTEPFGDSANDSTVITQW
jgi:hypothetical protein